MKEGVTASKIHSMKVEHCRSCRFFSQKNCDRVISHFFKPGSEKWAKKKRGKLRKRKYYSSKPV